MFPGTPLDWLVMRALTVDPNIIIKPADKGSCVMVWDRKDYLAEADSQLKDNERPMKIVVLGMQI